MNGVYIIERLTTIGVVMWAFLAVAVPAAIFFAVFRRFRAAKKLAAAEGAFPRRPGTSAEQPIGPVEGWTASTREFSREAPAPLFWTDGDDPRRFVSLDPPDWVRRRNP